MSENGSPFRVKISGAALAHQIKVLATTASTMGVKKEFLTSLAAIHQRLSKDPLGFGEPRFQTHNPNFMCRIGAMKPVAVHFAVHEELRLVLVLRVFLMGM